MKFIKHIITIQIIYALLIVSVFYSCSHQKFKNHLSNASSPYLQQHADNPVDWYEWNDETIAKAKKENKPLLISIGYSSCHWCHQMEKESFMDTSVARIMNENFINIKVDREERPDIDNIYMNASQLLSGSGGWPLNAFALPDGKPFFAGTYYSKAGWINLLGQIAKAYKQQNNKVVMQAEALTNGIAKTDLLLITDSSVSSSSSTIITPSFYQHLFDSLINKIDINNGGFKGFPKFPLPSVWEFLLQYHYLTGNQSALNTVINTLTKMGLGGIYDHIGGGFARYSTDSLWHVPHFEKMLYDNAQLISLYAHAYQVTKNDFFKSIITETADFVDKELTAADGGFYSSINADSENAEGDFYTVTNDAIKKMPGDKQSGLLTAYYNITINGNWQKGKNILFASYSPDEYAAINKISPANFNVQLTHFKKELLAERNKKIRPTTDDKILTSWNALMIKGYADAYAALSDDSFLKKAVSNATFIEKNMLGPDGHLWRNYRNGKTSVNAFLDDYALLAKAYIRLYQVTFNRDWLSLAEKITAYAITNFYDEKSGMFYYTPANSEKLVVRKMEIMDNVIPSSNALMAEVMYLIGIYFEKEDYLEKSKLMVSKTAGNMIQMTSHYPQWCWLAGLISKGTYEVAIMGKDAHQKNIEMQKSYLPKCIFMGGVNENLPLLENKLPENRTLIYVCVDKTCKLPVLDVTKALLQIKNN